MKISRYKLEDEVVRDLARWRATPPRLRAEYFGAEKTREEHVMKAYGVKGTRIPVGISGLNGFDELVRQFRGELKKKYKYAAEEGLMKRMRGMTLREVVKDGEEKIIEIKEKEIPPSEKAIEIGLRAFGGLKQQEVKGIIKHEHYKAEANAKVFEKARKELKGEEWREVKDDGKPQ